MTGRRELFANEAKHLVFHVSVSRHWWINQTVILDGGQSPPLFLPNSPFSSHPYTLLHLPTVPLSLSIPFILSFYPFPSSVLRNATVWTNVRFGHHRSTM